MVEQRKKTTDGRPLTAVILDKFEGTITINFDRDARIPPMGIPLLRKVGQLSNRRRLGDDQFIVPERHRNNVGTERLFLSMKRTFCAEKFALS